MTPLRHRFTAFATLLGLVAFWPRGLNAQSLRIQFLNVGQGDATLITTPEGRHVLIDAGRHPRAVAESLRAGGIDTLDLVIASHGHADHIGGIARIMQNTVVLSYVDNQMPDESRTYRKTKEAVAAEFGLHGPFNRTSDSVGSVRFRLLALPGDLDGQNNRSVGVVVQFGSFDALFTGDSEFGELDWWLAHDTVPSVEVVKVAHHGSINGTTEEWVAHTRPALAVISVGKNGYGHPAPNVVSLWSQAGATVLRTDQQGTIEVVADSTGRFRVTTWVGAWENDSLPRTP